MKPRAHQADFSDFHNRRGPYATLRPMLGTLAWHGMGLGKTLEALWEARLLLHTLRYQRIPAIPMKFVVVCPKSAVSTWKKECQANTPDIYRDMIIYPYSQLHNAIKAVRQFDIRLVIWDEVHTLKDPSTQRIGVVATFLLELARQNNQFREGRMIALTGTAMPNGAQELYTLWAMCCAPNLEEAARRLKDLENYEKWKLSFTEKKVKKFKKQKGKPWESEEVRHSWGGVSNADKLQQLLDPFVHFRRVSDCIDLPAKQEIPIDLGLPDDRLLKDANLEEPEAYMALLAKLSEAKTPHMLAWVDDFLHNGTNDQLIVFAMYRHPIEELAEKYPNHVRMITGKESNATRAQNEKDFQDGKFRILGMTFKAGSEALNFQNCSTTLYSGYPWHDAALQQAMARTFRSGQARCTLHYFLTSGQNDMKILDIVLRKAAATDVVQNLLLAKQGVHAPITKIITHTDYSVDEYI